MSASIRRAWSRRWLLIGLVGLAGWALLLMPAPTRQGVDFTVSVHRLPLYLKALGFVDRHYQYHHLARQITAGVSSDRDRALAVFTWTRQHIHPTPPELPVIDDHIWHIIIRGYGEDDQMADVFTTLATYAGVPAFWDVVEVKHRGRLVLSFAQIDTRWVVFDVAHGTVFADAEGRFFEVEELLAHPESFHVPAMLRARKQMPLPRLVFEIKRACRLIADREPSAPAARLAHAGVGR